MDEDDEIDGRAVMARAREQVRIFEDSGRMRATGSSEAEITEHEQSDWGFTRQHLREEREADQRSTALRHAIIRTWPLRAVQALVDRIGVRLQSRG